MSATLCIQPLSPDFAEIYKSAAAKYNDTPLRERNSGFDLFCDPTDINTEYSDYAVLVGQGCRAVAMVGKDPIGWWLAPRSSISRSPFRLANSLGLMDPTYRGVVRAALTALEPTDPKCFLDRPRLVQAVTPSLEPWLYVAIVDELPAVETQRGEGGFGSTGR